MSEWIKWIEIYVGYENVAWVVCAAVGAGCLVVAWRIWMLDMESDWVQTLVLFGVTLAGFAVLMFAA